jgi:putative tricarboxylic transport membrane protein
MVAEMYSDLISSLAWMIVAVFFCEGGIRLGLGSLSEPGPGFFPSIMGVFLFVVSGILFISSLRKMKGSSRDMIRTLWSTKGGFKRVLCGVVPTFLYICLLDYLGFVLTTFFFVFFFMRVFWTDKWIRVFCGAISAAGLSYVIFDILLKAHMPMGPLGF